MDELQTRMPSYTEHNIKWQQEQLFRRTAIDFIKRLIAKLFEKYPATPCY